MNKVLRKQAHVLVGLFLNLIILLSIFSCFTVTSFAADSAITEAEAKELLYEAYRIYMTYQDGSQKRFGGIGRLVTTTRDAVSSEAHRVYVDGIADSAWMYRCSSRKEDMQPTFSGNQDGTVTFVSFLPMGYRKYTISCSTITGGNSKGLSSKAALSNKYSHSISMCSRFLNSSSQCDGVRSAFSIPTIDRIHFNLSCICFVRSCAIMTSSFRRTTYCCSHFLGGVLRRPSSRITNRTGSLWFNIRSQAASQQSPSPFSMPSERK